MEEAKGQGKTALVVAAEMEMETWDTVVEGVMALVRPEAVVALQEATAVGARTALAVAVEMEMAEGMEVQDAVVL